MTIEDFRRFGLSFKCVLLRGLDENERPLPGSTATGFVRSEPDGNYLYTCWHVVTGLDPNHLVLTELPRKRYLAISSQRHSMQQPGVHLVTGHEVYHLPLYDRPQELSKPVWLQDNTHRPDLSLNSIGIYVPTWFDAVKIKLPPECQIPEVQVLTADFFPITGGYPYLGQQVTILGFPYGYSAAGDQQPVPIAINRHVASHNVPGRVSDMFLDGPAAPGMSGSPVFVELQGEMKLLGIYTGIEYPRRAMLGHAAAEAMDQERSMALGIFCYLGMHFQYSDFAFVRTPRCAVGNDGQRLDEWVPDESSLSPPPTDFAV